jgi:hypothetical protein
LWAFKFFIKLFLGQSHFWGLFDEATFGGFVKPILGLFK